MREHMLNDLTEMLTADPELAIVPLGGDHLERLFTYGQFSVTLIVRHSFIEARVSGYPVADWALRVSVDDGTAGADEFLIQQLVNFLRALRPMLLECECAAAYLDSAIHAECCPLAN